MSHIAARLARSDREVFGDFADRSWDGEYAHIEQHVAHSLRGGAALEEFHSKSVEYIETMIKIIDRMRDDVNTEADVVAERLDEAESNYDAVVNERDEAEKKLESLTAELADTKLDLQHARETIARLEAAATAKPVRRRASPKGVTL